MPRPLRSLRNRLAVIFGLIVLSAIGIVYFSVAPQLQGRLSDQKISELVDDSRRFSGPIEQVLGTDLPKEVVEGRTRLAAARASAEVIVLGVVGGTQSQVFVHVDSTPDGGLDFEDVRAVGRCLLYTSPSPRDS